jgi:ribosomal protein L37AE/L43A
MLTEKSPKSRCENCYDDTSAPFNVVNPSLTREAILLTEKSPKSRCEICDYVTSKKSNYDKHILTLKHTLLTEKSQKYQKSSTDFCCSICDYNTCIKQNYEKHLLTRKHGLLVKKSKSNDTNQNEKESKHVCDNCMAVYHSKQGLWNHKKKCKETFSTLAPVPTPDLAQMFITMVKQNNEFKELLIQQNEKDQELKNTIIELSKRENVVIHNTNNTNTNSNNTNTNSNNTNNFNINLFLNEKCKDALNITDFVNSLTIDFEDLEYVGNNGYVDGITNLFMKGLKELDIYKRPIHCTDVKRETIYIKDDDVWEKDTQCNSKIKKVIGKIANKNMMKISSWQHAHPECCVLDSSAYNLHMRIMKQSLNGGPPEQSDRNENKIVKNIARIVYIDKKEQIG